MKKKIKSNNYERWMMENGKVGECFFTKKATNNLTSISHYTNRKITTEKLIALNSNRKELKAYYIVKCILGEFIK